jgi:TM2 domain-containing membrane protein YozV
VAAGRLGFAAGAEMAPGAQALKAIVSNNTKIIVFIIILLGEWVWWLKELNKRFVNMFSPWLRA